MILTIAGSLNARSRSTTLLNVVSELLASHGAQLDPMTLRDVPADDLIQGRYDSPAVKAAADRIARAEALVVSSPVYKGSLSGALKALLDLMPENLLAGKAVLPLMSGGSPGHMLAMEFGMKPVLSVLGARPILPGVYAFDKQIRIQEQNQVELDEEVSARLRQSAELLITLISH